MGMKISEHADHTEKLFSLRAEDIHKWIDGYFDRQGFVEFLEKGRTPGWDPYEHRQFRHCREALGDAVREFADKYSEKDIESVFFCHLKDDYNGYIPSREDFANGNFREKYHEPDDSREPVLTREELEKYFNGKKYRAEKSAGGQGIISRFGLRITLPAAAAMLLFIAAVFIVILPLFHDSLLSEKKEMLEEMTSLAVSILDYYSGLEASGQLSEEQAKASSISEIVKLRYGPGNDNYFWITDMHPTMLMHPWRPDLVGRDLNGYKDSMNRSGKELFVESVRLVELDGGGFLQYLWQVDESSSRSVLKLSRVEGFSPWGWVIGTGIYINDIEEEISRLTGQLVLILLVITAALALFLLYLSLQSLKIENGRIRAEAGLIEAKERYRALVEASNEGYLLIMEGLTVFSNPTFRRMTGYSEEEISAAGFITRLFPDSSSSLDDNGHDDEFEAVIRCSSGALIETVIRKSKIFLPDENGLIISFIPLHHTQETKIPSFFRNDTPLTDPSVLFSELEGSSTGLQTARILNQLPTAVRTMLLTEAPSEDIRLFIADIYSRGLRKIASLAETECGTPPCEYTFLSLGSSGRREMTLFSDQDNALVFSCSDENSAADARRWFLNLSNKICGMLKQGGFPYCPGGIMAVNPAWCLSLKEWKEKYRDWLTTADNISLLDTHVFFDITAGWGSENLPDELFSTIFQEISTNPEFLMHLARNCLGYKAPQGILGNIRTEKRDGTQVINIKETLFPLINFARISALREGIRASSTLTRLHELTERGRLEPASYMEMERAFEILWKLRFANQVFAHGELRRINDDLNPGSLSVKNMKELKDAVATVAAVQSRLSYDFLGLDLS